MGIEPKNLHIHLRPFQSKGLLAEAQNLLRLQIQHQRGAITTWIRAPLTTLVQQIRIKIQQTSQSVAQVGPVRIAHQARFEIQGIGQTA